ncbi:acetate/propionate family kinase [uncultured Zoogloea sp.]|uniref:acetate/propionate family kinase n=1 Tax=uncultured Zoogloea sp. TaxID=160237 RepID=UPI0026308ECA|nr:acetate/propionate family kinase [uncultured Zoogloea sp.]
MKAVLILNAGSSSLKFALFPMTPKLADMPRLSGQVEGIGAEPLMTAKDTSSGERFTEALTVPAGTDQNGQHRLALEFIFDWINRHSPGVEIVAAGHRIVHGGDHYGAPVVLTPEVVAELETLIPLAPLHQPHNLRAIKSLFGLMPDVRQVGCFDTAFHRTRLPVAERFPLPRALFNEGVKRYGFHGLSYEYVSRQLPDLLGEEKARGAIIIAHLGNGASMCALNEGQSRDTSMGFTAVDGLMMGTRTGSLDPGVILHLVEQKGMDAKGLSNLIYKQSGLLGVSGLSQDMRALLESDEDSAKEAIELFCYRAACMIGQLSMAAGGLEALVFTGGIGEHAAPIRARIAEWLEWTGLRLYPAANQRHATRIHTKDSKVEVLVVPTNEEWMIGHHAVNLLGLG